jgi:hypothetical protein
MIEGEVGMQKGPETHITSSIPFLLGSVARRLVVEGERRWFL